MTIVKSKLFLTFVIKINVENHNLCEFSPRPMSYKAKVTSVLPKSILKRHFSKETIRHQSYPPWASPND